MLLTHALAVITALEAPILLSLAPLELSNLSMELPNQAIAFKLPQVSTPKTPVPSSTINTSVQLLTGAQQEQATFS